jgi:hypothetical protein
VETGLTTAASSLGKVDWSAPWLADFRQVAEPIVQAADWRAALNAAAQALELRNYRDLPLCFIAQEELPSGMAYEEFIGVSGCVPTRSNLHDFFNALMWLTYPQIKIQLNALQAAEILKSGIVRGRVRDGATIFDENAALFICADGAMADALRAHRWRDLFVAGRTGFERTCTVRLFGHALMDKLTMPYKAITAHAWVVEVEPAFFGLPALQQRSALDRIVGAQLAMGLTTANFSPLPVFGIPGWWPQQDEAFYEDAFVFRPKRLGHL